MYGHRVGQGDFVQLAEFILHQPVVEPDREFLFDGIDPLDGADIPVEDFFLVVVLRLNDLIPHLEPPSKPFSGGLTRARPVHNTPGGPLPIPRPARTPGRRAAELGRAGWGGLVWDRQRDLDDVYTGLRALPS